jgi:hypothetical protein
MHNQEYDMEHARLRPKISSTSLLTESAQRLEAKRAKLRSVLDPKNGLEELYSDQSFDASNAIERLQRCGPAIINMAMPEALFGILERLAVERERAVALVDQWVSGDPTARSEVSALFQKNGLDESAIEAEAIVMRLPTLIALTQLQVSQIAIRDKGLSGLAFCRELLLRSAQPGGVSLALRDSSPAESISDQRDHKHDH